MKVVNHSIIVCPLNNLIQIIIPSIILNNVFISLQKQIKVLFKYPNLNQNIFFITTKEKEDFDAQPPRDRAPMNFKSENISS